MCTGSSGVNAVPGAEQECLKVKQREIKEEGGAGKAGESKVKMPPAALAAFGSLVENKGLNRS